MFIKLSPFWLVSSGHTLVSKVHLRYGAQFLVLTMLAVASEMGFEKILEDAYPPVWGAGSVPSQQKAEQQFPFASY